MTKKLVPFLLLLFCVAAWGQEAVYRTLSNVPYYEESLRRQDAYLAERCVSDIYYPENIKKFPTVIWFHGGGLTGGEKHIPRELKEQGFCVVAVNYRLHPEVTCPKYVEDAAASVAWVFKHIREYGGDPDLIFVSGHSAGAYLTGLIGLDKHWLQAYDTDANRIAGLFMLSASAITHMTPRKERGIPDTQPIIDEYAAVYHVRPDTPPLFLMTGNRELEMLGRYEENAYLWRMMKLVGNRQTVLYEFDGYGHDMTAPAFPLMLKHIREICEQHARKPLSENRKEVTQGAQRAPSM
ncbi:MAG: alpha/beta hydrolase [Tannerella sp.]|jgi:acetyl esterase/lipase|nr:alpha/beta hydrolase [Tannerella sp.]